MSKTGQNSQVSQLVNLAMDRLGVALTIIDPKGKMLYYNERAAQLLDRKPAYSG